MTFITFVKTLTFSQLFIVANVITLAANIVGGYSQLAGAALHLLSLTVFTRALIVWMPKLIARMLKKD